MQFLSQRANTDPTPYLLLIGNGTEQRFTQPRAGTQYVPRDRYTQTRDPYPYLHEGGGRFYMDQDPWDFDGTVLWGDGESAGQWVEWGGGDFKWDARHQEFDPPVNAILAALRSDLRTHTFALASFNPQNVVDYHRRERLGEWVEYLESGTWPNEVTPWTPDAVSQALEVINRLVRISGGI